VEREHELAVMQAVARDISDGVGPFRRTLLNASRRDGALPELPDAQIEVLRRLDEDVWSTPTALGKTLGLARSTVSNLVTAMERDGLVARRLAAGDGRSTEVTLTELARERLRVYDRSAEHVLVAALDQLTPDEVQAVRSALPVLARIRDAVATSSTRPPREA
jgi:DNA-binding MarR family transcriptional regulator